MTTKYISLFMIWFAFSVCCISCGKWLDVKPKTEVSEKVLFVDEKGFKDALIGVYTQLGDRSLYGKEMTLALMDVLAQNYNVSLNSHPYYQGGRYNYKDAGVMSKIDAWWFGCYKAIANINNLLEQIDAKKEVFKGDNYQIIKGEALGLRALLHFDMLRVFGPIPGIGQDTKAIPYIKSFNMNVRPRLTLSQVVDSCIIDLNEAKRLLSVHKKVDLGVEDIFLSHTRNHMNYWAVTGLMARVYLYKSDAPNAYKSAREVIDAKVFEPVTATSAGSAVFPNRTFSTEHVFALYVSQLKDINNELFKQAAGSSVLTNTNTFINSRFEVSGGNSTDFRFTFLWKTDGAASTKYPAKFWQDMPNVVDNSAKRVPIIRLSELYYIASEASTDKADKLSLINEMRKNRGLPALSEALSLDDIDKEIAKEYQKEFYQEGQLFYYYKRKKYAKIGNLTIDPTVYVLPLPADEIEFNN